MQNQAAIHIHDVEKVAANFDKVTADTYEANSQRIGWISVAEESIKSLKARTSPETSGLIKIADLGTGPGVSARLLRESFGNTDITGVDISQKSLEEALERGDIQRAITSEIRGISVVAQNTEGNFHAALACGIMDFITPDQMDETVAEIAKLLEKGGAMSMTVEPAGALNPGVNANQHDLETLSATLNAHGITHIETTPASYSAWGPAARRGQETIDTVIVTGVKTEENGFDL